MSNLIKFPEKKFILTCHKCKLNGFHVILKSENPFDIKWFECMECENIFTLENIEKQLKEKHCEDISDGQR